MPSCSKHRKPCTDSVFWLWVSCRGHRLTPWIYQRSKRHLDSDKIRRVHLTSVLPQLLSVGEESMEKWWKKQLLPPLCEFTQNNWTSLAMFEGSASPFGSTQWRAHWGQEQRFWELSGVSYEKNCQTSQPKRRFYEAIPPQWPHHPKENNQILKIEASTWRTTGWIEISHW